MKNKRMVNEYGVPRTGQVESTGTFTVDVLAARRKLGLHLLPDPSFYLLKFVQAAVMVNCEGIQISCGTRSVEVHLRGWSPPTLSQELLATFHQAGSRTPTELLAGGLAALIGLKAKTVTLETESETVVFREGALAISSEPSEKKGTGVSLRADFQGRKRTQVNHELKVVRERCCFSPIPVELNGQPVDPLPHPKYHHRPLWNAYLPPDFILTQQRSESLPGKVLLRIGLARLAEIHFVRFGVTVDIHQVDLSVSGVQAVIWADHLETDLSGFKMREDAGYQATLEGVGQLAGELRDGFLAQDLDQLEAQTAPFSLTGSIRWRKSVSGTGLGIVGAGTVLLAATGDMVLGTFLVGSPLLLCASVATGSLLGAPLFAADEECHKDLREQIRLRLE